MEDYWGYHLVLDCSGCDIVKMSDKNNVYSWIKSLVKDIDMDPIGEPNIEYTAGHDINKAGFTAIQIIVLLEWPPNSELRIQVWKLLFKEY